MLTKVAFIWSRKKTILIYLKNVIHFCDAKLLNGSLNDTFCLISSSPYVLLWSSKGPAEGALLLPRKQFRPASLQTPSAFLPILNQHWRDKALATRQEEASASVPNRQHYITDH